MEHAKYAYFGCRPAKIHGFSFNGQPYLKMTGKLSYVNDEYVGIGSIGGLYTVELIASASKIVVIGPHEIDYSEFVTDPDLFFEELSQAYKNNI